MSHRDVIVVGASAGGVEALQQLVARLPADLDASICIVLHIPGDTPSMLHKVLNQTSSLPVKSATDKEALRHGTIYVAPTDRHLVFEDQHIRLTRGPRENRVRPCIDVLFRSASVEFGERVIGIVLTGTLDDGTAGLWAVKDRKGMAIVQDPDEAEWDSMPLSALNNVKVDYTLPIDGIADILKSLTCEEIGNDAPPPRPSMTLETAIAIKGDGLKRGVMAIGEISANTCPECHGVLVRIREGSIIRFRCHTGHAFSLQTLLADVDRAVDQSLWNATRAIEERSLVLREMERVAVEEKRSDLAVKYAALAVDAEDRAQHIRHLVVHGHDDA